MTSGNSREITTNQPGPHDKLTELVTKHLAHPSQKPVSEHTLQAFNDAADWLDGWQGPLIIDACCGVGESTAHIAAQHPHARVIGVDKSAVRTDKHRHYGVDCDNYRVIRADLNDFWRLARQAGWRLEKHYLLYPNPYPKASQVQKRWHASAAFREILLLGGTLEVRSNWRIYIEEVALALQIAGIQAECVPYRAAQPQTPFERKYWDSGQQSWHLVADVSGYAAATPSG